MELPPKANIGAPVVKAHLMRRHGVRVFFFVAALVALFWLLHGTGWSVIGQTFVRIGVRGAALLLALASLETWLDARALETAIGVVLPPMRAFAYNGSGSIVNVLVPWDAGEVVKGALFARHVSTPVSIAGIVLWNYLFKFTRPTVALGAALLGWAIGASLIEPIPRLIALATLIGFIPFIVLRLVLRAGLAVWLVSLLRQLRVIKGKAERLEDGARELDFALSRFRESRPADFRNTIAIQIFARITGWAFFAAASQTMGLSYDFATLAVLYAGVSVSSYVAMLVPARLGVNEGAAWIFFEALDLPGEDGLLIALVLRLAALTVNGCGALYAALEGRKAAG